METLRESFKTHLKACTVFPFLSQQKAQLQHVYSTGMDVLESVNPTNTWLSSLVSAVGIYGH